MRAGAGTEGCRWPEGSCPRAGSGASRDVGGSSYSPRVPGELGEWGTWLVSCPVLSETFPLRVLYVFLERACWPWLGQGEASSRLPLGLWKRGAGTSCRRAWQRQCPSGVCPAYHSQRPCGEVPRVMPIYRQGNRGSERKGGLSGYIPPGAWSWLRAPS